MTLPPLLTTWIAVIGCGFAAPPTSAPQPTSQPLARERSPTAALSACVRTLIDEARKSRTDGALVRSSANFASDFRESLPGPLVRERLLRPVDRDRFVDAYVRWQLTSFAPDLEPAKISDREFAAVITSLPPCVENPQADFGLIDALQRASKIGALSDAQQEEINARLNALAAQTSAASALAMPSMQLRQWFRQQFEAANQHSRFMLLLLDAASSLAAAGWPVDDAKAVIDRAAEHAAKQREFTSEQRRAFAIAAQRYITGTRLHVASAGLSNGAISVNYAATGIFDFDVRRWQSMLLSP